MQTKLRRIDALLKQRSRYGDDGTYDAKDFQNDLKGEVDELNGQNDTIKEKVRKLRVIERGLAAGPALAAKPNKYAHVQGKLEVTHSKVTRQYQTIIEELRAQHVTNQKETFRLENESRQIRTFTGSDKGGAGLANLKNNI